MGDAVPKSLIAAAAIAALCRCSQPDLYTNDGGIIGVAGSGGAGSGSGGNGSSSSGGCQVAWEGGDRTFGDALVLSNDPASAVVQTLFLPAALTEAVVLEPGGPSLSLVTVDSATVSQRLDSAALPVSLSVPIGVTAATDGSDAVVDYGVALSFVASDGDADGPFSLSAAGLLSVSAVVALEQGAGAVILGADSSGPVWTTLGPNGFGPFNPIDFGVLPTGTQPAPAVWDDGQGNLWALLEVSYDNGGSLGLFAMRGSGSPLVFGAPVELDTVAPGQVTGVAMALGPTGELGVLISEGSGPALAGYVVSGAASVGGGLIESLAAPLGFAPPPPTAWANPCAAGACDPALRFAADGELIAAWTSRGELSLARLPAGASAWETPQQLTGGPLTSGLAVDSMDDVAALVQSTGQSSGGPGLAVLAPGAAPLLEPLPSGVTFGSAALSAATSAGTGSLWGFETAQPGTLTSDTFSIAGAAAPAAGAAVDLPSPELTASLTSASSSAPSSAGPGFFAAAVPGWMLIAATEGSAGDLLLASEDPASGLLGAPVSVASSGWQQMTGVQDGALRVDPQGDALVVFSQQTASGQVRYVTGAVAGGSPGTICAPLPTAQGAAAPFVAVDQLPYGPSALGGSGRIAVYSSSPATVSLAK